VTECIEEIASMRLWASSIMTMFPFNEISKASRADLCRRSGYGSVTICGLSAKAYQ
jgi:hypothetical protein